MPRRVATLVVPFLAGSVGAGLNPAPSGGSTPALTGIPEFSLRVQDEEPDDRDEEEEGWDRDEEDEDEEEDSDEDEEVWQVRSGWVPCGRQLIPVSA